MKEDDTVRAGTLGDTARGRTFLAVEHPACTYWLGNALAPRTGNGGFILLIVASLLLNLIVAAGGRMPPVHSLLAIIEQLIEHDGRRVDLDFKGLGGYSPSIRERMQAIPGHAPDPRREDAARPGASERFARPQKNPPKRVLLLCCPRSRVRPPPLRSAPGSR